MTADAASFTFFTHSPAGTGHWIASMLAMLMISGAALWFAARRRRQAGESNGEMEKLYRLANAVMESGNGKSTVQQIADQLLDIFELEGVTLFDRQNGQIARAGIAAAIPDQTVQEIAARARPMESI